MPRLPKFVFLTGLLLLIGCDPRNNTIIPKPIDPCVDAKKDTVYITTRERLQVSVSDFIDPIANQDTFALNTRVYFKAFIPNAKSYEWTIGTDDRKFTSNEFFLNFSFASNSKITVKLKAIKDASKCFDDAEVLITKDIVFYEPKTGPFRWLGKWRGITLDDKNNVFEIDIRYFKREIVTGVYDSSLYFINFPKGCNDTSNLFLTSLTTLQSGNTYAFVPEGTSTCNGPFDWFIPQSQLRQVPYGFVKPNRSDSIYINYAVGVNINSRQVKKFAGVRIRNN